MSLFLKQEFTPPVFSRKWIAIKFRPNMLLRSRNHIISILESGLMFREDSAKVEQLSPAAEELWTVCGGDCSGWMTRGERILSVIGIGAAVFICPPRFHGTPRHIALHISSYAFVPLFVRITHRLMARGSYLNTLLMYMKQYLVTARRTMACVKEYRLLYKNLSSVTTIIESCTSLLYQQQSELALLMARSSSAVLGNFPWLYEDVDWESIYSIGDKIDNPSEGDLVKIHHAYLVVQSTLLKHMSIAHFLQPLNIRKTYKNHNERLHWLHNDLIYNIINNFKENFESLDRMYRLLRNCSSQGVNPKRSVKVDDNWLYSEVHSEVVRTSIELKVAFEKCVGLDKLLDSCCENKQKLDLGILDKDLDELIGYITKCLSTAQNSQIRLSKIKSKLDIKDAVSLIGDGPAQAGDTNDEVIIKINDSDEPKDEVYYFVKTEDDFKKEKAEDLTTVPGKKERDTNRVVLVELKRKLGKREDMMRDRERRALEETMPELIGSIPEFPRQINIEDFTEMKGYIAKMKKQQKWLFKIEHDSNKKRFFTRPIRLERSSYKDLSELIDFYEGVNRSSRLYITVNRTRKGFKLTKWYKEYKLNQCKALNGFKNDNNYKCSKKDLELSPSSSDSDFEFQKEKRDFLQDVRRNRVARKKNYPSNNVSVASGDMDESLRPVEYSFGTGMALASVLQLHLNGNPANRGAEEVFIGDGEVSSDSGNDDSD